MKTEYVLLFIITCLVLIVVYWINDRKSKLLPGPWSLPIVGYLPWLDSKKPYISLAKLAEKYGPIYGLYFGSIYTVIVSDIDLIKKIQMKNEATGRPDLYLTEILTSNKGIANVQGELWKNQRKFLCNFLNNAGVSRFSWNRKNLEEAITRQALEFVEYVQNKGTSVVLDPADALVHNVGSITNIVLLGKSYSRDDEAWQSVLNGVHDVITHIKFTGALTFFPFLRIIPKYGAQVKGVKRVVSNLVKTFEAMIIKRKDVLHEKNDFDIIHVFSEERQRSQNESIYTDSQLIHLLKDMFIGGIETTVTSLSWYFLYMAVHQEVQAELRNELLETLQERSPTLDDVPNLPYLRATLAEVARIRTIAPLNAPHSALEDIHLENLTIPKGSMIISLLWSVHTNPKVWKDPDIFRPERFLDEEGRFHRPEAFIPFHIGKRMCAGKELAKMTSYLFAANIVKNFHMDCETNMIDMEGVAAATLQPKPYKLRFTKM